MSLGKLFQRPKSSFLDKNITELISEQTKNKDIYTINPESTFFEIIGKIIADENLEDVVVVVEQKSSENIIGIIADVDILAWIKDNMESTEQEELYRINAADIVKDINHNRDFFYADENITLREALKVMKENKVDHILVLDKNMEYKGWVNHHSVIRKIRLDILRTKK